MLTGSREIRNCITPDGRVPFKEWLDSLQDKKVQTVVLNRINRVQLGNFGDVESVIVILLCGGPKRSQSRDIKRAREYWLEFKESHL